MKFNIDKKKIEKIERHFNTKKRILTEEEYIEKEKCENSLAFFVKTFWNVVVPEPFVPTWHIDIVSEHLEAVYHGFIKNLLLNQPPRTAKSLIGCVFFPAWAFVKDPTLWFLYTAYSHDLTKRDSIWCRFVIKDEKYQLYWGDRVAIHPEINTVIQYQLTAGGGRRAGSVRGANTGHGASISVVDDPNNVLHAESIAEEELTNNWFSGVMPTRVRKFADHKVVVIQQRCGLRDLSNHILNNETFDKHWVHLVLPMEFVPDRRCTTIILPSSPDKPWSDPRTEYGELLCPDLIDPKSLEGLKARFHNNPHRVACQLQQHPTPEEGGMIRPQWFSYWTEKYYPRFVYILQSWDTALVDSKNASHSACSTYGVFHDEKNQTHIMLISLFTGQLVYPFLKQMALRLYNNYDDMYYDHPLKTHIRKKPHHILIEKKVSGFGLLQDFMHMEIPVKAFNPNKYGAKITRCGNVTDLIQAGRFWLPCTQQDGQPLTDFAKHFFDAALAFPGRREGADTNDVIDSMSQALITLKEMGLVFISKDCNNQIIPTLLERP